MILFHDESKFTFKTEDFYSNLEYKKETIQTQEVSGSGGEQKALSDEVLCYYYDAEEEERNQGKPVSEDNTKDLRKSTREKCKPKYLNNYTVLALCAESFVEDVPQQFDDIFGRDDEEKWRPAVNEEIKSLVDNKTWDLVSLPSGRKPDLL